MTDGSAWSSFETSVFTPNDTGLLTAVGGGTANAISQAGQECTSYYMSDAHCLCNSYVDSGASGECSVGTPAYAVLTYNSNIQGTCLPKPVPGVERTYTAYDNYNNEIPVSVGWTLHETVTSKSSCGMGTDGSDTSTDFVDTIYNCQSGCTFTSTQWYSASYPPNQGPTYTLQAKDCPSCAAHTGYSVTATSTSTPSVTDN